MLPKLILTKVGSDLEVLRLVIGAFIIPFNPIIGGAIVLFQAIVTALMTLVIGSMIEEDEEDMEQDTARTSTPEAARSSTFEVDESSTDGFDRTLIPETSTQEARVTITREVSNDEAITTF